MNYDYKTILEYTERLHNEKPDAFKDVNNSVKFLDFIMEYNDVELLNLLIKYKFVLPHRVVTMLPYFSNQVFDIIYDYIEENKIGVNWNIDDCLLFNFAEKFNQDPERFLKLYNKVSDETKTIKNKNGYDILFFLISERKEKIVSFLIEHKVINKGNMITKNNNMTMLYFIEKMLSNDE